MKERRDGLQRRDDSRLSLYAGMMMDNSGQRRALPVASVLEAVEDCLRLDRGPPTSVSAQVVAMRMKCPSSTI
jgi:hypothetical protein